MTACSSGSVCLQVCPVMCKYNDELSIHQTQIKLNAQSMNFTGRTFPVLDEKVDQHRLSGQTSNIMSLFYDKVSVVQPCDCFYSEVHTSLKFLFLLGWPRVTQPGHDTGLLLSPFAKKATGYIQLSNHSNSWISLT